MIGNASGRESRRRVLLLTAVAVLAALTLFARVALDVALVLVMCAGVFVFQRTAGDWLSDVLGARFGTLIFASVIAIFLWSLLMTGGGQSVAERFFTVAGAHGFHTAFLDGQLIPPSSVHRLPPSASPQGGPQPTTSTSGAQNAVHGEPQSAAGAGGASRTRAGGAARNGSGVPTQVDLQLTSNRANVGQRVVATAIVHATGEAVDGGVVVFTVNGLSRAVTVRGGIATVDIVETRSGRCEVQADYRGTSRFAPASSALAVLLVE